MRLDNISETWKKNKRKEEEEEDDDDDDEEDGDSTCLFVYKVLLWGATIT